MKARASLLTAVVLLAGCQYAEVEQTPTPDPAAVPSWSPQAIGATATGPIVQLGSGVISGLGWRYLAYPSDDGWCLQLETQEVTDTGCGRVPPDDGSAFASVSQNGPIVHGIASEDTATVFLIIDTLRRVPATLLALDEAGLEGLAFVGIAPADANITHVMAVKHNGEISETFELP